MPTINRTRVSKTAKNAGYATEAELWQANCRISSLLSRVEELEAQVIILRNGGKEKDYYTVEEAAQIWGVSKSNLYLMIRQGRLPAVKIGEAVRISRATLLEGTD